MFYIIFFTLTAVTQNAFWQLLFQDAFLLQLHGELLFGLSYLPTAQRLSFSLIKVNNIKVEKIKEEESISKSWGREFTLCTIAPDSQTPT